MANQEAKAQRGAVYAVRADQEIDHAITAAQSLLRLLRQARQQMVDGQGQFASETLWEAKEVAQQVRNATERAYNNADALRLETQTGG